MFDKQSQNDMFFLMRSFRLLTNRNNLVYLLQNSKARVACLRVNRLANNNKKQEHQYIDEKALTKKSIRHVTT